MRPALRARGFTLVEVLVALVIVAFGMGALMATLTSAADSVGHLRDKSFAEWIALNRISEMRLRVIRPPVGKTSGEVEYAGKRWKWAQQVEKVAVADLYRIDVSVTQVDGPKQAKQNELAMASGFFNSALRPTDGKTPDWSGVQYEIIAKQGTQSPPTLSPPTPTPTPANPLTNPQATQ
jgi:general secretion pathway protein I